MASDNHDSKLELPDNMVIEVSAYCNRKCPWCPQSTSPRTDKTAKMSLDTFDKIIVELSSVGYTGKVAFHFFNEPLLDDRLEDLVARARKLLPKSHLYIHTNGDHLTIERLRSLRAAGLDGMFTNQYGGEVQPHIQAILDARTEDEKTVMKIRMFKKRHIYSRGGLVETVRQVPTSARCRRIRQMCINYLGDVVLCCNDYLGQVSVGNVKDKGVIELYNDPLLRHYRDELRHGRRAGLKLCDKCDL